MRYVLANFDYQWTQWILNYDKKKKDNLFKKLFRNTPGALTKVFKAILNEIPPKFWKVFEARRCISLRWYDRNIDNDHISAHAKYGV